MVKTTQESDDKAMILGAWGPAAVQGISLGPLGTSGRSRAHALFLQLTVFLTLLSGNSTQPIFSLCPSEFPARALCWNTSEGIRWCLVHKQGGFSLF